MSALTKQQAHLLYEALEDGMGRQAFFHKLSFIRQFTQGIPATYEFTASRRTYVLHFSTEYRFYVLRSDSRQDDTTRLINRNIARL